MTIDPRTPVLVGAATASQRIEDPAGAAEALELMVTAARGALDDAGAPGLAPRLGLVAVPKGTWAYADAGRLVAGALGTSGARTVLADLGVLQTTPFRVAAEAIAAGDVEAALVVGGEAKFRQLRSAITSTPVADTEDAGAAPDEVLRPHGRIIAAEEVAAGLTNAPTHYAMIENARRAAEGLSIPEHARQVAELWARFNIVARDNPEAWNPAPMSAEEIASPGPRNRPVAFPYLKWHNSQWNVDQAAALVLCSVEAARRHGVSEDAWVFPHAIVESNHMVPVSQRAELHRSPGFAVVGQRAAAAAGTAIEGVEHVDLYSCFPVAVRVQVEELGLAPDRLLTVTGGMTFAGGPMNNYVLQSTVAMARVLRGDPDARGLVTAISGMITKQGVGIWGARPPASGFASVDVSAEAEAATSTVAVRPEAEGPARVVTYTVAAGESGPERTVVLAELAGGDRALAVSADPVLADAATREELCGHRIRLDGEGGFALGD